MRGIVSILVCDDDSWWVNGYNDTFAPSEFAAMKPYDLVRHEKAEFDIIPMKRAKGLVEELGCTNSVGFKTDHFHEGNTLL